ncbi:hypothetical protein UFOVP71_287 [uncultured Caudovirales phage]|uniref:Uncharacterized protein n=1 Tax=uncultured Caudovirales phage TaxID=2100421 RepID=A0A6J5TBS4_9CAUD|nr:hypothetical protein UFOVP71_287 [uncultured Caudovirales phage]
MSKQFNNSHGTTSSEFSIGVGGRGARHVVLGAVCHSGNALALDKEGQEIKVAGTEFFDLKMLAKDQDGNIATKQIRGTITVGGHITKVEDVFEEGFNGNVNLTLSGNTLSISCAKGTATTATYSVYVALQRIE